MPSHLTRSIFRRLLSSEPLVFHSHSARHARTHSPRHHARLTLPHPPQRRTFLNMFKEKPKRDLAEPLLDPGMREMLTLEKKLHLIVRTQHPEELQTAFCKFVQAKVDSNQPIEDFHALRLLQTLEVLEKDQQKPSGHRDFWVPADHLRLALKALATNPEGKLEAVHSTLAKKIHARIPIKPHKNEDNKKVPKHQARTDALVDLLSVLSCTGDTVDARNMLLDTMAQKVHMNPDRLSEAWLLVLKGFAREDNERELLKTLELMAENNVPVQDNMRSALASYYARKDNIAEVKKWFTPELLQQSDAHQPGSTQTLRLYQELLEFCLRNGELGWVESVFEDMSRVWQQKAVVLAAAATGKSVSEIDRMLHVLAQHDQAGATIDIFNSLIAFAASKGDPYNAERYFNLAQSRGLQPDAQTYIHQVGYRLDAGDLTGAQAAYENLREQSIVANEDWDIMNKMVQVLVTDRNTPKDVIMGLAADISARKKLFPAQTVSALVQYHLDRDEYFELVDLLQTYAYQYSIRDRQAMLDTLATAALEPEQDTTRTWDIYMIFHQIFDVETTRALRQAVMERMFARSRPDLGIHVFSRMSAHARTDVRPDQSTYVAALSGIARNAGADALEVVHNLLKLDTEVEPNTQIRTALMLAYTAHGAPWRALEFWDDIATSAEGPSISSLHAAMRACERSPFGERTARAVWERLRASDVPLDASLLASYVGALAGTRQLDECRALVPRMPELTGAPVDTFVLGTMFNATAGLTDQEDVQDWIALEYPALWAQLEAQGFDEDERDFCTVRGIDRSLDP